MLITNGSSLKLEFYQKKDEERKCLPVRMRWRTAGYDYNEARAAAVHCRAPQSTAWTRCTLTWARHCRQYFHRESVGLSAVHYTCHHSNHYQNHSNHWFINKQRQYFASILQANCCLCAQQTVMVELRSQVGQLIPNVRGRSQGYISDPPIIHERSCCYWSRTALLI